MAAVASPARTSEEHEPDVDMSADPEDPAFAGTPAPRRRSASASPRTTPQTQTPNPGRGRRERPAAYQYVGSELRRIMVLASVVVAAIIGLGFVL